MAGNEIFNADDVINEHDIHLEYIPARMSRRIFSKVFDFVIAIVLGCLAFVGVSKLVNLTPTAKANHEYMNEVLLETGIYTQTDDGMEDSVNYIESQDYSGKERMDAYTSVIDKFITYVTSKDADKGKTVQEDYDSYRISLDMNGVSMFIENDGVIKMNPECTGSDIYNTYCDDCYQPYVDNHLRGFLLSCFPKYVECTNYATRIVLLCELPISVLLATLVVYFLFPMAIFRRNRQTLGMFIYKVGKANHSLLHISAGRYVAYYFIWTIGIIALSFVTLGVPLLVSATMMVFTKNKQDFPDYMLQLHDIDVTDMKLYYSLAEISEEHSHSKAVAESFQMEHIEG